MLRQSISLTKANDEWLRKLLEEEEYSSKSEIVNDLIRQARRQQEQTEWLRIKLKEAEESGSTTESKEEILRQSKSRL